jgi:cytochrome P450
LTSTEMLPFPAPRAQGCPFDPPPGVQALQEETPLARVRLPNGATPWLVTRYADQKALLADPRVSSDPRRPGYPSPLPSGPMVTEGAPISFILMDDPEHARLRRMVTAPFTIKRIEAMRPGVQQVVDDLIDEVLAGPNPVDLVQAFALPVPSLVICQLLGVPYADHGFFQESSNVLINRETSVDEKASSSRQLFGYLDELIGKKLDNPGEDLLSGLAGRIKAGQLSRHDAAQMGVLMLIAGHETTANMMALGTLALLEHPDQLALLRETDDPKLVASAVEELLRYLHITHNGRRRVAIEDIEVGGRLIRAGEGVIMANDIANRTPRSSPTRTGWTSAATTAATWRSASGCTSASASHWPGWNCRSSTAPSTAASRRCASLPT